MVALLMIASAMILGLQALRHGRDAAAMAEEARAARLLAMHLLETGPRSFDPAAGRSQGFDWVLETQLAGLERPIAVCRRAVVLTSLESGRVFPASTRSICPDEAPT